MNNVLKEQPNVDMGEGSGSDKVLDFPLSRVENKRFVATDNRGVTGLPYEEQDSFDKKTLDYKAKNHIRDIKITIPAYYEAQVVLTKSADYFDEFYFNPSDTANEKNDNGVIESISLERGEEVKVDKEMYVGNSIFLTISSVLMGSSLAMFFLSDLPKIVSGGMALVSILGFALVAVTLGSFKGEI